MQAGNSIQAAIDMAPEGATIRLQPGTYMQSIVVNKPGILLEGDGNVTLQNPGSYDIGILVQDGANQFTLRNITIRGFRERGLNMTHVNSYLLSHVTVISNGEFGLFTQYCTNGTIEHCEGTGHDETGVFVGQSSHITVSKNHMYANVIGLEAENSSFVSFDKNHVRDNAVGIFCSLVPNRIVKQALNNSITNNQVRENNHANFAGDGEQEQILPSGTGILVLGADNTLVQANHVSDNQFTGIALISTTVYGVLGIPIDGIEPFPDGTKIISNKLRHNGYNPVSGLPFPVPGVDLLWLPELGPGNNNCWSKNLFSTSYPASLPSCP